MAKKGYFTESMSLRLPAGSSERIEKAARESGMSSPEWLRRAVRRALKAHAKEQSRTGRAR